MNLFLHIGTNKTGSSFLQSALIENKSILKSQGFYLVPSKWDEKMASGKISPGNGHELAKLLCLYDQDLLTKYLRKLIEEAKQVQASSIILSNEVIIRLFSDKDIVTNFYNAAQAAGFQNVNVLGVIRQPTEHALSLYKHRAKAGQYPDYQQWFHHDYETMRLFDDFLKIYDTVAINWKFVLYQKDAEYMLEMFFKDWLHTENIQMPESKSVNKSLNLEEIQVLCDYELKKKGSGKYLYKELISLKQHQKCGEAFKREEFIKIAGAYFQQYTPVIEGLNKILEGDQKLVVLQNSSGPVEKDVLTEAQEKAIKRALNRYHQDRKGMKNLIRLMKQLVIKVKASSSPKNQFDAEKFGGMLAS